MAAEAAEVLIARGPVPAEAELGTWIPANWRTSASAGVLGLALAGPAGGFLGVVNTVITGPEAMQPESALGQATHYTVATGLVVACVAGGHILLATAGIAGLSFNAAQYMMEPGADCNHDSQVNEGEAREEEQDTESLASVDDELADEIQDVSDVHPPQSWLSSLPCFAGCAGWMFSSAAPVSEEPDLDVGEQRKHLLRRSHRNLRELEGSDASFLLFETTNLPKPKIQRRCDAAMLRPVTPLALNNGGKEAIVNEYFTGHVLMMHRPMETQTQQTPARYSEYFAKKTRRWELRLQGRFHKRPNGKLYMGVVLRDFDYSVPLSFFTSWLSTLSITPLEYVVGSKVTLNFGDREQAAMKDEAMFAQVVAGLQAFDQIIVTPPGAKCVPPIDGDLDGMGITRKGAQSSAVWSSMIEEIEEGIQPGNVYTLCFWSASRFLDLMGGALTDLIPLLPAISLSTFLDKWPPHFVFYVLEKDRATEPGEPGELLHLERNKTYVLDLMMLAKSNSNLHLAKRYYFPEKSE